MADAIAIFKDAFSSYKKNLSDYAIYSIVTSILSGAMVLALVALFIIMGVLSAGGIFSTLFSGNNISLGLVGIGVGILILAVAFAAFAWLQGGLIGAYLDTINSILSGRKPTLSGMLKSVPRFASGVFLVSILAGIIAGFPLLLLAVLGGIIGGLPGVLLIFFGLSLTMLISLLFTFAVPGVVLDRKGAIAALSSSFFKATRNIGSVAIFILICIVLAIPNLFPLISLLYVPLFYMPLTYAALLMLYKKAN